MTRVLLWLERRHARKTTRWNSTHPKPCITTRLTIETEEKP